MTDCPPGNRGQWKCPDCWPWNSMQIQTGLLPGSFRIVPFRHHVWLIWIFSARDCRCSRSRVIGGMSRQRAAEQQPDDLYGPFGQRRRHLWADHLNIKNTRLKEAAAPQNHKCLCVRVCVHQRICCHTHTHTPIKVIQYLAGAPLFARC